MTVVFIAGLVAGAAAAIAVIAAYRQRAQLAAMVHGSRVQSPTTFRVRFTRKWRSSNPSHERIERRGTPATPQVDEDGARTRKRTSQSLQDDCDSSHLDNTKCVVCYDSTHLVDLHPCGHSHVCEACVCKIISGNERECPLCRSRIEGFNETEDTADSYKMHLE